MNEIGHNNPPSMCFTAGEVCMDLSRWMAEHPVIQNEVEVKEATVLIDRAVLCIKDMEDERKAQTRPLREKVQEIDDSYRGPRGLLESVTDELKSRWRAFVDKIETERQAAAEAARLESDRRKSIALQAEANERAAIGNAASGELGIEVAGITAEADAAFAYFKAAERAAELAERAKKVKFKGIFKSRSLSNVKTISLLDRQQVFNYVCMMPEIEEALLKAARAYKRIHGKYPPGIHETTERRL